MSYRYIIDSNGRLRDLLGHYAKKPTKPVKARSVTTGRTVTWSPKKPKKAPKKPIKRPTKKRPTKPAKPTKKRPTKPKPKPKKEPRKKPPTKKPIPETAERMRVVLKDATEILSELGVPLAKLGTEVRKTMKSYEVILGELQDAKSKMLDPDWLRNAGFSDLVVEGKSTVGVDDVRIVLNSDGSVDAEIKVVDPGTLEPRQVMILLEMSMDPVPGTWTTSGIRFWSPKDLEDEYGKHAGMAEINTFYARSVPVKFQENFAIAREKLIGGLINARKEENRPPDKIEQYFVRIHWNPEGLQPDRNGRPLTIEQWIEKRKEAKERGAETRRLRKKQQKEDEEF
jgi:hypothetical protein